MHFTNKYPEYAAIEHQIRRANIQRVVVIAEAISGFIANCWNELKRPPRAAAVIINGRYPWTGIKGKLATPR